MSKKAFNKTRKKKVKKHFNKRASKYRGTKKVNFPNDKLKSEKNLSLYCLFVAYLKDKIPVLIFGLGFGFLICLFYLFWISSFCMENVIDPLVNLNAKIASKVLIILGQNTTNSGSLILNWRSKLITRIE